MTEGNRADISPGYYIRYATCGKLVLAGSDVEQAHAESKDGKPSESCLRWWKRRE